MLRIQIIPLSKVHRWCRDMMMVAKRHNSTQYYLYGMGMSTSLYKKTVIFPDEIVGEL